MFFHKLRAVGYPNAETFNPSEETWIRHLVAWLEDNIFNTDLPNLINSLRVLSNPGWDKNFVVYLRETQCPFELSPEKKEMTSVLDWLLREAVRFVAEDQTEILRAVKVPQVPKSQINLFRSIDWSGKHFRDGVVKMSSLLKVPLHPDYFVVQSAVAAILFNLSASKNQQNDKPNLSTAFPMQLIISGFDTNDNALNDACKILRLLHIQQLRRLQTQIDVAVVEAQQLTANPLTDEKLGQVGF